MSSSTAAASLPTLPPSSRPHGHHDKMCECQVSFKYRYARRDVEHLIAIEPMADGSEDPILNLNQSPDNMNQYQYFKWSQHILKSINSRSNSSSPSPPSDSAGSLMSPKLDHQAAHDPAQKRIQLALNHVVMEKTIYLNCQNRYYFYTFDSDDLQLVKEYAFGSQL